MNVRKFVSGLLIVVLMLLVGQVPMNTSAAKYDVYEYEMYDESSVIITKYTGGASDKLVIPAEINGYPVKVIGEDAFSDKDIYEVVLPDTLEVIEDFAFWNTALYSVTIPRSVSHIGVGAFSGILFTEYKVEKYNKTYRTYQGSLYNTSLSELIAFPTVAKFNINPDTKTIAPYAFISALSLKDVYIPASVKTISEGAFMYSSIESVNISNASYIGYYAFYGCENLTSVDIRVSTAAVSPYAFEETPWLNNQPDGLIYFNDDHMVYKYKGDAPERIELKPGTYAINGKAFAQQKNIKEIVIPQSTGHIDFSAFDECSSLENIVVENNSSYKSVEGMLYSGDESRLYVCPAGKVGSVTLSNKTRFLEAYAFEYCEKVTDINLSQSIIEVGEGAFFGCTGLKSLKFPNSVKTVGGAVFYGCTSLEDVIIPEGCTAFSYYDFYDTRWYELQPEGVLYLCNNALGYKGDPTEITELTFKEGTLAVSEDAFFGFESLTKVTFPETLEKIGDYAFATCPSLKEVSIPSGIKSLGIESFGFIRTYDEETGHWSHSKISEFVVKGYDNTDAMNYANFHKFEFVSLGKPVFSGMLGDTDGNGIINVRDATAIQKHMAALIVLNPYLYENADFNGDGYVNVKDATAIQKYLVGLF